jgi:hypothetical protein
MKKSQKSQPVRDSTRVLRIVKIGSLFKIILFVTESDKTVSTKREMPRIKLPIDGKMANDERLTPAIEITASVRTAVLYEGSVNIEE